MRRTLLIMLLVMTGSVWSRSPDVVTAQNAPRPAGTLPAVEQPILLALRRAGLSGRVVRIAADTNGFMTVAAIIFTYRAVGPSVLNDLQEFAWKLVTATFTSGAPGLDQVMLTGFHDVGGVFDARRRDATFTMAVSTQEFTRVGRSASAAEALRSVPRVWYYPALLMSTDAARALTQLAFDVPPEGSQRERRPAFTGDVDERTIESEHQQRGARTGRVVEEKLYRGNPTLPRLALTFDDGPGPLYTTLLLDTLDRIGVKATFFLVGLRVQQYPYLAQAIAARGHELGNHSFHHANLVHLPEARLPEELGAAQQAIERATGITPRYFRPPGGDYNAAVLRAAHELGLITVFWTDDPADYAAPPFEQLERTLLARVTNGGILLLHQGVAETIRVLPPTVQILRRRGFVLTTVSGLLAGSGRR